MPTPQTTGSTSPTFTNILMTRYNRKVPTLIHRERPILALLNDHGQDTLETKNRTTQFGHQVTRTSNQRWYGANDPSSYANRDGGLDFAAPQVTYVKNYTPQVISEESFHEAGPEGALTDGVKRVLEDIPESIGADYERLFLQQEGNGVLFKVKNNETAGSNVVVEIDTLGGQSGQEIGHILRNMSLKNFKVSFVAGGTIGSTAIRSATADKISSYVDTLGSESLTFSTLTPNLTAADYIVLSRDDLSTGTYPAATHPVGLFGLVDDYGKLATFQNMTSTTDPEFISRVLANGGTKEAITTNILSQMCVSAKVRGTPDRPDGSIKHAFICSTTMEEAIAQLAESDRRFGFSQVFDEKGVKPYLGVNTSALRYKGVPFFSSPLAPRNSMWLLDTEDCYVVHNGPRWGQFIVRDHPLESGPQRQWVYMVYNNFGMWRRNTSVRRDDLTTPSYI